MAGVVVGSGASGALALDGGGLSRVTVELEAESAFDLGDDAVSLDGGARDMVLVFPSGLIGCWPLDETQGMVANDVSGKNRPGALSSAGVWTSGVHDGGLHLAAGATLSVAALGGPAFPATGALSFWFRGPAASSSNLYAIFDSFNFSRDHFFARGYTSGELQAACQLFADGGTPYPAVVETPMSIDAWNHVVLMWQTQAGGFPSSGTPSWTVSINGSISVIPFNPATRSPTQQSFIFGGSRPIDLDEVELYDRVLADEEIKTLP